jgi:hypothetical protein
MAKGRSAAALTPLLVTAACAWPSPERQLLIDFFQACRVYDTTVLARLSTTSCDPRGDGVVQDFDIVSVADVGTAAQPAREVLIDARVRQLGGAPVPEMMMVRLRELDGRWMVAGFRRLPVSRTSP